MKIQYRYLLIFFLTGLVAIIFTNPLAAQFGGGDGSEENPFLIETADHLNSIRGVYLQQGLFFSQNAEINLGVSPFNSNEGWEPIGIDYNDPFMGNFNGNGFSIYNLFIIRDNSDHIGLFGYIEDAVVRNVRLINVEIYGDNSVGGLAGYQRSSIITDCWTTGRVSGGMNTGGLVGFSRGDTQYPSYIARSYSTCEVFSASDNVGGLVGLAFEEAYIDNCFATGNVTGHSKTGGFTGWLYEGAEINNCYAAGSVTGHNFVGGLVGVYETSRIGNSYSNGLVIGNFNVGGLIGSADSGVDYSYWDVETSGQGTSPAGEGFTTEEMTHPHAGYVYYGWDFQNQWNEDRDYDINNGYPYLQWYIDPELVFFAGGDGTEGDPYLISNAEQLYNVRHFSGFFELISDIELGEAPWSSYAGWLPIGHEERPFTGVFDSGTYSISGLYIERPALNYNGLFGYVSQGVLNNISLTGIDVNGMHYVGGIAGYLEEGTVLNCSVSGSINGVSLIGGITGQSLDGSVAESSFTGDAGNSSSNYVGGIVGYNQDSIIESCYSHGNIIGAAYIGGAAGRNTIDGEIYNSYATGVVTGGTNPVGGFIGSNNGEIINCYSIGFIDGGYGYSGFSGSNSGTIIDSYWDLATSGQTGSMGGEGKIAVDLVREISGFYANWDFTNVWAMTDYTTYPYLQWQDEPGINNYPPNGYYKIFRDSNYYWESFPVLWNRDLNGDQCGREVLDPLTYHTYIQVQNDIDELLEWNGVFWSLPTIYFNSTRGYQISFLTTDEFNLIVAGDNGLPVNEQFDSIVTIYNDRQENWVGYFIPQIQCAFTAFSGILDDLKEIKSQEWSVWRTGEGPDDWISNAREPKVEFG